jgi:octaprenyl-diphosphate synthase
MIDPKKIYKAYKFAKNMSNNNDKDKVKFVIDHVVSYGGIDYAEQKMNEYRDKALLILNSFPTSPAREALEELVLYTTDRKF